MRDFLTILWVALFVVSVVFPFLFALFLLLFSISMTPVVIGVFVANFFAILACWHFSAKRLKD